MKPPPTLEAVWTAVKSARTHGWTREAIGARLREAGASWGADGLVACPEGERAGLVSDFGHHPTWRADRARFCAELRVIGVSYREVADAADQCDPPAPRPSQMDTDERAEVLRSLRAGGFWMAAVIVVRALKVDKAGG